MSSSFDSHLLDKLIAPGISIFTRADIPDLAGRFPEAEYWVTNFFLNNILPPRYVDQLRQLALAFLRRAQLAVDAYAEARDLTLKYLDGNNPDNPRIRAYYAAVARWENFAIESSIAMDVLKHIKIRIGDDRETFRPGDGSPEQRLHHLANKVKHAGDDIRDKGRYALTDSVALWLSEAGLNGIGARATQVVRVTYAEAAQFMEDIAKIADDIQDPQTFPEKVSGQSATPPPAIPPSS